MSILRNLESEEPYSNIPVVALDQRMIEKIIIAGMLICKGSTEDIQRFIVEVFGISVSIGKISSVINEAALTAERWNESIDLSTIKIGANDEIFQGHSPILVGVDPLTTYTYLLNSAKHRDATTWGTYLLEKEKHQKLHLELSVNDGGLGLQKGVKEAFPDANIQLDVFHTEYDFSKAVCSAERSAYKDIKIEEKSIPLEIVHKMWKQLGFSHVSADCNHLEAEIVRSLGCSYDAIHQKVKAILNKTVRASSIFLLFYKL